MIGQAFWVPFHRSRRINLQFTSYIIFTNVLSTKKLFHVCLNDACEARISSHTECRWQFLIQGLRKLLPLRFCVKKTNILQKGAINVSGQHQGSKPTAETRKFRRTNSKAKLQTQVPCSSEQTLGSGRFGTFQEFV